jgi:hypothetical protein
MTILARLAQRDAPFVRKGRLRDTLFLSSTRRGGEAVPCSYHPKDPRVRRREVAAKPFEPMRAAGRFPNAGAVFGRSTDAAASPVNGFFAEDRRHGRCSALLEDGDVPHDHGDSRRDEPDDGLVTLLSESPADARVGGSGWPVGDRAVTDVAGEPDRRASQHPHAGPERRG